MFITFYIFYFIISQKYNLLLLRSFKLNNHFRKLKTVLFALKIKQKSIGLLCF